MSATLANNSIVRIDRMDLINKSDLPSDANAMRSLSSFIKTYKQYADAVLSYTKGVSISGSSHDGYKVYFWSTPNMGVSVEREGDAFKFELFSTGDNSKIITEKTIHDCLVFPASTTDKW